MKKISRKRKFINKILGIDLKDIQASVQNVNDRLDVFTPEVLARLRDIEIKSHHLEDRLISEHEILKSDRDNIPELRNRLFEARGSSEYKATFKDLNPLVTIRIATYNRANALVNVAIKSVLNQTYQKFEIIVIGDGCTDDTEEKIAALKDGRIKFINLPNRSIYPVDSQKRWMVAGSPGMNLGAYLAKGRWILPLDDDDEFTPDHIQKLLDLALFNKSELVYGALDQVNTLNEEKYKIWSDPPELSKFSFQGAMYMGLLKFFQYDQQSWVVGEPGDWNLCRRMMLAGIRYSSTTDVVGLMNMTTYDKKKS